MNTLVIFSGLPGTGKSTLAQQLARESQWAWLCIDDVLGEIPANPDVAFWDSKVAILLELAEAQIELGLSVIVDSVFMNTDRHHAQQIAVKYGARFRPIYTFVSDDQIWKQRVIGRFNMLSNKNVATWEQVQRQRRHFREWEQNTALFIDSLDGVDQNYVRVLDFVMRDDMNLLPLDGVPFSTGSYH